MINLPEKFKNDINSKNISVIPLVVINDNIFLSTSSTPFKDVSGTTIYFSPILKNIPAIRESVDFDTRKYRISNVSLELYNHEFKGSRFSDTIGDISLINSTVEIYFKTPSAINLNDCLKVYTGFIQRYEHDEYSVKISLEDKSQLFLKEKLPVAHTSDDSHLPHRYKNAPIPIVYGSVDKSRCVQTYTSDIVQGNQQLYITDSEWCQGVDKVYAAVSGVYALILPRNRYYPYTAGGTSEATPQYYIATDGSQNIGSYILFQTYLTGSGGDSRRNAVANNHCEVAVYREPISFEGNYRVIFGTPYVISWYAWDQDNNIQVFWYESEKIKLYENEEDIYPMEEVSFPAYLQKKTTTPIIESENIQIGTRSYDPNNIQASDIVPLPEDLANIENVESSWNINTQSRCEFKWEFSNAIPSSELLNVVQLQDGDSMLPECPSFVHIKMGIEGLHNNLNAGALYFAMGNDSVDHLGELRYITYFDFQDNNDQLDNGLMRGSRLDDGIIPHFYTQGNSSSLFKTTLITDHLDNALNYTNDDSPLFFFENDDTAYDVGVYTQLPNNGNAYSWDDVDAIGHGYQTSAFIDQTDGLGVEGVGNGFAMQNPMNDLLSEDIDYGYAWITNFHDMNDSLRMQFDTAMYPSSGDVDLWESPGINDEYDMIPSFPNGTMNYPYVDVNDHIYNVKMRIDELSMWTYAIINNFSDRDIYAAVRGRVDTIDLFYTDGNTMLTTMADRGRAYLRINYPETYSTQSLGKSSYTPTPQSDFTSLDRDWGKTGPIGGTTGSSSGGGGGGAD
tara:strand:+ start:210 stop:2579 length:2370 start_codon:yes stop_codon:yes gene_type:complete